jgi:hypothetical protein
MCGLRSKVETRSLFQLLRDLFRRGSSRREVAEVVPLPETASARPTQAEAAEEKSRSEAA